MAPAASAPHAAAVAVYNLKGGVGKTTVAVNLAWCSASLSRRRTLLWDLDPQGAASHLLGTADAPRPKAGAMALFARDLDPVKSVTASSIDGVDLLRADASLREVDRLFFDLAKKRRLARLLEGLGARYDRIIIDCPPGLTETAQQVMRAADMMIVPVIPSALSTRAFDEVIDFMAEKKSRQSRVLPVFSMVDRRRAAHCALLAQHPRWPVIPMASVIERSAGAQLAVGVYAPRSPAAAAFAKLWRVVERELKRGE